MEFREFSIDIGLLYGIAIQVETILDQEELGVPNLYEWISNVSRFE